MSLLCSLNSNKILISLILLVISIGPFFLNQSYNNGLSTHINDKVLEAAKYSEIIYNSNTDCKILSRLGNEHGKFGICENVEVHPNRLYLVYKGTDPSNNTEVSYSLNSRTILSFCVYLLIVFFSFISFVKDWHISVFPFILSMVIIYITSLMLIYSVTSDNGTSYKISKNNIVEVGKIFSDNTFEKYLKNTESKIVITGHSKGGAEAALLYSEIIKKYKNQFQENKFSLITFAALSSLEGNSALNGTNFLISSDLAYIKNDLALNEFSAKKVEILSSERPLILIVLILSIFSAWRFCSIKKICIVLIAAMVIFGLFIMYKNSRKIHKIESYNSILKEINKKNSPLSIRFYLWTKDEVK